MKSKKKVKISLRSSSKCKNGSVAIVDVIAYIHQHFIRLAIEQLI